MAITPTILDAGGAQTKGLQFWPTITGTVTYDDTEKAYKCASAAAPGTISNIQKDTTLNSGNGVYISFRLKFTALPNVDTWIGPASSATSFKLNLLTSGKLQIFINGPGTFDSTTTLLANTYYRVSMYVKNAVSGANDFRLWIDGTLEITKTNETLTTTGIFNTKIGWNASPNVLTNLFIRDIVFENITTVPTDENYRVTSKQPTADKTQGSGLTYFATAIGAAQSAGSHYLNVNERALSETNGWSEIDTTQREESYAVGAASVGDEDITGNTIAAIGAWIWAKDSSGTNGTPTIVRDGTAVAITLTTSYALYISLVSQTTYPSGDRACGMQSTGNAADAFLTEAGSILLSIPAVATAPQGESEMTATARGRQRPPGPTAQPSLLVGSLAGQDRVYGGPGQLPAYDWKVPPGARRGLGLRTHLDAHLLTTLMPLARFLEPGSSATHDLGLFDALTQTGSGAVTSDTLALTQGSRSVKCDTGATAGSLAYAKETFAFPLPRGRESFYLRFDATVTDSTQFFALRDAASDNVFTLRRSDSSGKIQLRSNMVQIGADGADLLLGTIYRVSVAWDISTTAINELRVFVDGVLTISATNATLATAACDGFVIGWYSVSASAASQILRFSDLYVDARGTLDDPGMIWVTAKRPSAAGAANAFDTAIGANPANRWENVHERPLSEVNGWRHAATGLAREAFGVEALALGDRSLAGHALVGRMAWARAAAGASATPLYLVHDGAAVAVTIGTAPDKYVDLMDVTAYPASADAIGLEHPAGEVADAFLYECGLVFASIPPSIPPSTGPDVGMEQMMMGSPVLVGW